MAWRRILPLIARQVEQKCNIAQSKYTHSTGHFAWNFTKEGSALEGIHNPFYYFYRQEQGISTSRQFLAATVSDVQPVPSPLSQIPALTSGNAEAQSEAAHKRKVQAVLKDIKQSPKKVNLVAALVRGMRVEDALLQMQVTVKRAAKTVYKVMHSARANAVHNHGLDADRLIIAEAFVGKGLFLKRLWPHAKGRSGIRVRPRCRLTVVVRELTPEEETEIAKLRVQRFKKLSKRESRLVPHKLVETQWQWHRKPKERTVSCATT
ncbi:hypothetical protein SUGI_0892880 [Cryptomeria japonica]|uniref:uncharacterized protein LOC131046956 n=1 Tax=Cryptomeria japonica TaxID=3369 RepID=UPI002414924F|nr:uncharacterized protein LOC131046956 [Cryptomeria japonica]GLJ43022.1 hypothetical protein SUGI_0892880 [Cryptomeria japonica]